MLTGSREDYIKAVYLSNEGLVKISNKDLAERFNISAASVSEMMKKLIGLGHLKKDTQLGYILSDTTEEEAKLIIKKHRLWEVFFVEKLGLNWADVHQDAEILEHSTSDILAERLNEFLEYPKYCPHGSVIYGNGGSKDLQALVNLEVGMTGKLIKVKDSKELLEYLDSVGLDRSETLKVIKIEPYKGNIHIETKDGNIGISYTAAQDLYIGDLK